LPVISTTDNRLWSVEDLSAYLSIPVPTLYRWRRYGCGPPCRMAEGPRQLVHAQRARRERGGDT
jgi:hypothetical protein